VSPKLPLVSGRDVVKLLGRLGYEVVRQRGSHIRLRMMTEEGEHYITVPDHKEMAKGTLSDILSAASRTTGIAKKNLIEMLRRI
jgi:predicted RNA binding protein YcfA (HicA-like mRNA interferase family)